MHSKTNSVSINATPEKVWKFLADPQNLPRWAVGFAKAVRRENGAWLVTTGGGELPLRVEADPKTRVVDFIMSPSPGVEILAASRVVENGRASEYVFTQFQHAQMRDDVFDANVKALEHELTVLRAVLEVECPL